MGQPGEEDERGREGERREDGDEEEGRRRQAPRPERGALGSRPAAATGVGARIER